MSKKLPQPLMEMRPWVKARFRLLRLPQLLSPVPRPAPEFSGPWVLRLPQ